MKCESCINEAKYIYEGMDLCGDCLFEKLTDNEVITSSTETTWYLQGEYIGNTCSGLEIEIDEIADYFSIEEVVTNE